MIRSRGFGVVGQDPPGAEKPVSAATLLQALQGEAVMLVELYVDPACGWSQVVVRWLADVSSRRQVDVRLLPYSLLLRDGDHGDSPAKLDRRRASLRAVRVLESLTTEDPALGWAFWDAVVAQDGPEPFADLQQAAERAGVVAHLAAADEDGVDAALSRRMAAADQLAGGPAVLPLLVLEGRVAFTGPLVRTAPGEDSAAVLWDGVVALARTEGFYELSRPRPAHPAIPGLPPVDVPPVLAADADGPLGRLVRGYIERVVNRQDVTAVDELVAPDYVGGGFDWAPDRDQLRSFYLDQARERPDWRIDVQETVELGDSVVARAVAGGTVTVDGVAHRRELEWLTHYRVADGRIREIRVLSVVPRAEPTASSRSRPAVP